MGKLEASLHPIERIDISAEMAPKKPRNDWRKKYSEAQTLIKEQGRAYGALEEEYWTLLEFTEGLLGQHAMLIKQLADVQQAHVDHVALLKRRDRKAALILAKTIVNETLAQCDTYWHAIADRYLGREVDADADDEQ